MKKNTLRWFGYIKRKTSKEFVKKVYLSEVMGPRRRGRPVVRWKNWVKEDMHEKVANREAGIEISRRQSLNRARWKLFCREVHFRRERVVRNYR